MAMSETEEKKWTLERIQILMDDLMHTLELEKEEHTTLAQNYINRIFEVRNSALAGLGFIASVILALAAINIITAFVIETIIIIGAIGFAFFYIMNIINDKIARTLNLAWFAYYGSIKAVTAVKRFIFISSMSLDNLTKRDCATLWLISNLVPGICGQFINENYTKMARSLVLNQLETHFRFKANQGKGEFDEGYEAYIEVRKIILSQKEKYPEHLMHLFEPYEQRYSKSKKKES